MNKYVPKDWLPKYDTRFWRWYWSKPRFWQNKMNKENPVRFLIRMFPWWKR